MNRITAINMTRKNRKATPKLDSLTIFFPFLNDAGTVKKQIDDAYYYGRKVAKSLEVIAIHGGASKDDTFERIKQSQKTHRSLKIVDKTNNTEWYAVIKHGFYNATKDWVFYTDGDRQYQLNELSKLVAKQLKTNSDVVNGYKTRRDDGYFRWFMGEAYRRFTLLVYRMPVNDLDCDFRLIRMKLLRKVKFESKDSSILLELIGKLRNKGAKFAEVPVSHYQRVYGKSNYPVTRLFWEKLVGDFKIYGKLKKYRAKK